MKTVRLGCTDIGAILFAGIDDDNNLYSTYISVGGDGEFTGLLTTNKAEIPINIWPYVYQLLLAKNLRWQ